MALHSINCKAVRGKADKAHSDNRKYWVGPMCASRDTKGTMNTTVPRLLSGASQLDRSVGTFTNYFRMDRELFTLLANLVRPEIVKETT